MKKPLLLALGILVSCGYACKPDAQRFQPEQLGHSQESRMAIEYQIQPADTNSIKELVRRAGLLSAEFPDSAVNLYYEALGLSKRIQYNQGIAVNLLNIGNYYYTYKEDFMQARTFFTQALAYVDSPDITNAKLLPGAHLSMANAHFREGNYDSANFYYYKTLDVMEKKNAVDTPLLITVYMNLGSALEFVDKNFERSIKYSRRAMQLAVSQNDTFMQSRILKNIGTLYTRKRNYDSAFILYSRALQLIKPLNQTSETQEAYTYVANVLLHKGDLKKAKMYLDSATNIKPEKAKNNVVLMQSLGGFYLYSGKLKTAIPYYKRILELSEETGEQGTSKISSYIALSDIYDSLGRWQLAYNYQKALGNLKDSLLNAEKLKISNQLEIKYRTAEKDRQLARKNLEILKAEAKSQRTAGILWISSLCIILLVGSVFFLRYRQKNKLQQLDQQKALDLLKAGMEGEEKERVRVGQELHDGISGLLSAIKMNLATLRLNRADIAGERNFITTMELADEAADELRKTAHNLVSSNLESKGLFKAIQGFCERVASPQLNLQLVETGTPRRLDSAKELIIYRNIQELVHNMIRHSQASKGEISLSWQNTLLLITVEDNGKGISSDEENTGIGFENIRSSIQKLAGTLEIESHSGAGTSIYLEYPI